MLETKGGCGIRSIDYVDSEKIDKLTKTANITKTCHLKHNQNTNPYNNQNSNLNSNPTSNSDSFRRGFIYGAIAGATLVLVFLCITFTKIEYQAKPEKIENAPIEYDLPEPVYKIYTPGVTRA